MTELISLSQLIAQTGIVNYVILTLILAALVLSVWKVPHAVKEIGIGALAVSVLMALVSWWRTINTMASCGFEISPNLLWMGARYSITIIVYGLTIYIISLALRIWLKNRK